MMNENDDLRSLLTAADVDEKLVVTAPPTMHELQARWSARRRRRATMASGAAVVVLAAWMAAPRMTAPRMTAPRRDGATPSPQAEVVRGAGEAADAVQMQRELARLDREAEQSLATARRLQMARRIEQARGETLAYKPLAANDQMAGEHIDRAVMISVAHADRLGSMLGDMQSAVELYRHVAELFPDSRWSAVARERIKAASAMN